MIFFMVNFVGMRGFEFLGGIYVAIALVIGAYLAFRGAALIDYLGSDTFNNMLADFAMGLGVPKALLDGIKNPADFTYADTAYLRNLLRSAVTMCVPCSLF
jgi:hypothetical protein